MLNKVRAAFAAYRLYADPNRLDQFLDMVTRLADAEKLGALADVLAKTSAVAASSLEERRLIVVDPDALGRCPAGSLGWAVHDHCVTNGIHPATFPKRPNETRAQFVLAHIENTHDVWHAVTGFAADAPGEIGLQAFYLAQFPNLVGLILLGIAPLHALAKDPSSYPELLEQVTRGWLLGKRASCLFGVPWDALWSRPLEDVRRELGIDLAGVDRAMEPGTRELARRVPRAVALAASA